MKVLQICSARNIGGGERHVADLATGLVRRGHEVFAAVRPGAAIINELQELRSQNILQLQLRGAAGLSSIARLTSIVRDHKIGILHAHLARDYPVAAMVAARTGVPYVLTRHVLFPMKRINGVLLRRVSRVIAVSNAVAEVLRKQNIFAPKKVVMIHNAIDLARFQNATGKPKGNGTTVGMVGEITPIKGQKDFVRAAAIISKERVDVQFVIAGEDRSADGHNRREVEDLIVRHSLYGRVRLIGWHHDVASLIGSFDVYVSPSRVDAFGIAIVEAMACRVPVVATASAGAREIIHDDVNGMLVPIGEPDALASAITTLLDQSDKRRTLAANASDTVRRRFSLEQMVEATEAVYRDAVGGV